ncbi:2-phosphosulfolactate phosphatase [Reichenbachiella versicolor]|uniref:2-phosphosulfolactate phosphatase n=1 Tax=Reichenbachiella versicolor TaxID=1821036 RepID=UPI000D6E57CA|nr:2-phosphosulfolactate phosphatase [Reichenbachiella versicolor]
MSPQLIDLYDLEGKIVVVVDVLRATSVMVTALAYGAKNILPVATLEEAKLHLGNRDSICAAERGGDKVEGFPYDNSPFSYMCDNVKDKCLVMTTTNGTLAITKSRTAEDVIIGAFINIKAVANYIIKKNQDVIIHCAGWKGKTNMEDTLFAGALMDLLKGTHDMACDTPHIAMNYFESVRLSLKETIKNSAHAKRLNKLSIEKDIEFCATLDEFSVVPKLEGDKLIPVHMS